MTYFSYAYFGQVFPAITKYPITVPCGNALILPNKCVFVVTGNRWRENSEEAGFVHTAASS